MPLRACFIQKHVVGFGNVNGMWEIQESLDKLGVASKYQYIYKLANFSLYTVLQWKQKQLCLTCMNSEYIPLLIQSESTTEPLRSKHLDDILQKLCLPTCLVTQWSAFRVGDIQNNLTLIGHNGPNHAKTFNTSWPGRTGRPSMPSVRFQKCQNNPCQ